MGRAFRSAASAYALVALLVFAGLAHLLAPTNFELIIPHFLAGQRRLLVTSTGYMELLLAVGIGIPRLRSTSALVTAVFFVAVFPANIQMALDGGIVGAGFPLDSALLSWLRLLLQPALIWWALEVGRSRP